MVMVVGSRGIKYRGQMREYIHTSHIKCGIAAKAVDLSVTEFRNVTYKALIVHVNNLHLHSYNVYIYCSS